MRHVGNCRGCGATVTRELDRAPQLTWCEDCVKARRASDRASYARELADERAYVGRLPHLTVAHVTRPSPN